jgi:hypothetical protein
MLNGGHRRQGVDTRKSRSRWRRSKRQRGRASCRGSRGMLSRARGSRGMMGHGHRWWWWWHRRGSRSTLARLGGFMFTLLDFMYMCFCFPSKLLCF